ncbi:hypothetical protein D3C75_879860 [compost metagenome]
MAANQHEITRREWHEGYLYKGQYGSSQQNHRGADVVCIFRIHLPAYERACKAGSVRIPVYRAGSGVLPDYPQKEARACHKFSPDGHSDLYRPVY